MISDPAADAALRGLSSALLGLLEPTTGLGAGDMAMRRAPRHPNPDQTRGHPVTPAAAALANCPDEVLRAGNSLNERGRQHIRLARYFEQLGHRPTWLEIINERARRSK